MQKRGEYFAQEQDTAWLIIHCLNKFVKLFIIIMLFVKGCGLAATSFL